jgi:hypothetical protein
MFLATDPRIDDIRPFLHHVAALHFMFGTQKNSGGQYAEGPSGGPSKPIFACRLSLVVNERIYLCFQYLTSQIGVSSAASEWA